MVLLYLHDWVILDKGKCWDSNSSTMEHMAMGMFEKLHMNISQTIACLVTYK